MRWRAAIALLLASGACSKHHEPEAKPNLPPPDPRGCLAATIEHHEHTDDRDGISHDVRYKEHFVRCEDRVWTERILPRGLPDEVAHAHERHAMPPAFTLARLVEAAAEKASLSLVSRAERRVIAISPESYEAMHFDADFDAAAHLIPSRSIAAMEIEQGRAAPDGAEWRTRKSAAGVVRVLWSKRHDFPLAIESESDGGAKHDSITIALEPLPSELPWAEIGNYEKKSDMDYMD